MNNDISFVCLASGSDGNCYVFKKGHESVLIECGLEWKDFLVRLTLNDVDINSIKAVICTHRHSDHVKSIQKFVDLQIPVFLPKDEQLYNFYSNFNNIKFFDNETIELTSWLKVKTFDVSHDVIAKGFAFLDTENKKSILFINDTRLFDFKMYNVRFDYVFIECNHIRKIVETLMQQALDLSREHEVNKYKRQASYHMSLESCKKFLRKLDLTNTKAIFLMHLSKECCNKDIVKDEIKQLTKKEMVLICERQGGFY